MFLTGIDYVILALYVVALIATGLYLRQKRGEEDIFLGGRSLKWWQIGFSLFSANASPMMLIGFAGIGFSQGVVGSNFEWLAWIFLMVMAMVFLPHYLATGVSTMPQFLKLRFGNRAYNFLVIYSLISILFIWLGSALYAGGLLLSQIFDCALWKMVVSIAVIATLFTAIGGFKAVVRTGIFQSVIIILSSVILTYCALKRIGGVGKLVTSVSGNYWKLFRPASDPEYSWIAVIAGYPVVAIYYWCTDQTIVQKTLAAKNLKEGQLGALFIASLKIIMPLIFIFPGIMCFVLFKNEARPDNAYMTLVKELMPHGLIGLCIAALIAALMDAVSSGLNSFSTIFTLDVIGRFVTLSEAGKRRTGRWLTVAAAFCAIFIAMLFSWSGKGFFELSQGLVSILAPPLSVVFLFGILWKRASRFAAEVVLYGGGLLCLFIGACHVLGYPSKTFWPHFLLLSFYVFCGLSAVMILVSFLPKADEKMATPLVLEKGGMVRAVNRAVWTRWGVLALVMMVIYWIFR